MILATYPIDGFLLRIETLADPVLFRVIGRARNLEDHFGTGWDRSLDPQGLRRQCCLLAEHALIVQYQKAKLKVPTPTLSQKLAKLINSKVASDSRIGQDAHGYWECAEIAQLVEQRIRNA